MSHRRYFLHDLCPVWPNGKKCYHKVNLAVYACQCLAAKFPEDRFEVFKCSYCRHWHVGRGEKEVST